MKRKLLKHAIIGVLMPFCLHAQETETTVKLKDAAKNAAIETRVTAGYLGKKYGVTIDSNHALYQIIHKKNLGINLALAIYNHTAAEDQHIAGIISRYEEQMATYLKPLAATGYINKQIAVLDSVKPLSAEQKTNLNNLFLNRTKVSDDSYSEILKGALNRVSADTAYYAALFGKEIDRKAREITSNFSIKNQLPAKVLAGSGKHVYEQQRALLLADYAFPKGSKEKEEMVRHINLKYQPAIDSTLIAQGFKLPGTRLAGLALQRRQTLKLSEQQVSAITSVCIAIANQKTSYMAENPGGKYDSRSYEYEQLPKILSEAQYNNLLALKFRDQALKDAEETWIKIQKEGLDKNLDSEQQKRLLQGYFLSKMIAKEKFTNRKDLQHAQVKSIDDLKPLIIKRLDALQKEQNRKEDLKKALLW